MMSSFISLHHSTKIPLITHEFSNRYFVVSFGCIRIHVVFYSSSRHFVHISVTGQSLIGSCLSADLITWLGFASPIS